MPDLITRRQYLLDAIRADGQPVTTQRAAQLMDGSPWPTTGRNTARKDLRGLARAGLLITVSLQSGTATRRAYDLPVGGGQ
ncbi:hypothetical protein [Streptomyces sp. BBFR109]|uniref:hypothetical protein n=1 Tax=Streptomyces sp. BBFR109 TaxID=3448172 RepID=UPI003F75D839